MAHSKPQRCDDLVAQLEREGFIQAVDQEMFERDNSTISRSFYITLESKGGPDGKTAHPAGETHRPKSTSEVEYQTIKVEHHRELGSGGFGAVYAAKLMFGDKGVQYICLKQGLQYDNDTDTNEHIIREANHMRKFKVHPSDYVIQFKFSCQEVGGSENDLRERVFIGMDHFEGFDLGNIIRDLRTRKKKFTRKHMIAIIEKTTNAVKHIQKELGMIHCDIKPKNVLFNCESLHLKLIDFGCAVLEGEHARGGTAEYTAPEIIKDKYGASLTKSDIYSIGALMFRVITFEKPYHHVKQICAIRDNDAKDAHNQVTAMLRKQFQAYEKRLLHDGHGTDELVRDLPQQQQARDSCDSVNLLDSCRTDLQSLIADWNSTCFDFNKYPHLFELVSDMLSYCLELRPTVDIILERIVLLKDQLHVSASQLTMSSVSSEPNFSSLNSSPSEVAKTGLSSNPNLPHSMLLCSTTGKGTSADSHIQEKHREKIANRRSQDDDEPATGANPLTQADDDAEEDYGDMPLGDDLDDIQDLSRSARRMPTIPETVGSPAQAFEPKRTSTPLRLADTKKKTGGPIPVNLSLKNSKPCSSQPAQEQPEAPLINLIPSTPEVTSQRMASAFNPQEEQAVSNGLPRLSDTNSQRTETRPLSPEAECGGGADDNDDVFSEVKVEHRNNASSTVNQMPEGATGLSVLPEPNSTTSPDSAGIPLLEDCRIMTPEAVSDQADNLSDDGEQEGTGLDSGGNSLVDHCRIMTPEVVHNQEVNKNVNANQEFTALHAAESRMEEENRITTPEDESDKEKGHHKEQSAASEKQLEVCSKESYRTVGRPISQTAGKEQENGSVLGDSNFESRNNEGSTDTSNLAQATVPMTLSDSAGVNVEEVILIVSPVDDARGNNIDEEKESTTL